MFSVLSCVYASFIIREQCLFSLRPFQVLQDGSNDIKIIAAESIKHVARVNPAPLDNTLLKVIVPALLATSKEKNTAVKSAAESALLYVLRLRDGESTLQVTIPNNVYFKNLKALRHGDFADFGLNCSEISGRQLNP